jgi:hypothetical protein
MSEDPVLSPAMGVFEVSLNIKNGRMAHSLFHLYRNAIRARLIANGIIGNNAYVVIAGPANTYAHYVTTIEEYGVQRYEGASTLFGPCESPVRLWRRENITDRVARLQLPSTPTSTNIPVFCHTWRTMRRPDKCRRQTLHLLT